jgi:hypothetical protein
MMGPGKWKYISGRADCGGWAGRLLPARIA